MSSNAENQGEGKKAGRLKLIIILLVTVILLGSVALGYFIFFAPDRSSEAKETSEIFKATLDTFTVNLSDMEYRRYLRTDITLEFYNEGGLEEVEHKKHRVRDKIITLLNQKSVSDFDTNQKLEKTRMEILKALNEILGEDDQIKAMYFETFIIQ